MASDVEPFWLQPGLWHLCPGALVQDDSSLLGCLTASVAAGVEDALTPALAIIEKVVGPVAPSSLSATPATPTASTGSVRGRLKGLSTIVGGGRRMKAGKTRVKKPTEVDVPPEDIFSTTGKHWQCQVRTWLKHHGDVKVFGPGFPLTPDNMKRVTVIFRVKGYRSTANYVVAAKRMHQASDHHWSGPLKIMYRECMRIARRKLGPACPARAFLLIKVARCYVDNVAVHSTMLAPYHTVLVGALLMYRGIEIGDMLMEDVSFNGADTSVSVRLSSSKTDSQGRGLKFRWRCICGETAASSDNLQQLMCPYHALLQAAIILHDFEICDWAVTVGGASPFFRTDSGRKITPRVIGQFLQRLHLAAREGIAGEDVDEENQKFGGHSVRRSGAQHWVRCGLPEALLRRLARWRSDSIERYLQSVPLENLGPEHLLATGAEHNVEIRKMLTEVKQLLAAHRRTSFQRANPPPSFDSLVAVNRYPGKEPKVHRIRCLRGYNSEWATACSWKFGTATAIC